MGAPAKSVAASRPELRLIALGSNSSGTIPLSIVVEVPPSRPPRMPNSTATTTSAAYPSTPTCAHAAAVRKITNPVAPKIVMSLRRSTLSWSRPPGSSSAPRTNPMAESISVARAGDSVIDSAMIGRLKSWMLFDSDVHVPATNHWP